MEPTEARVPAARRWAKPVIAALIAAGLAGYAARDRLLGRPIATCEAVRGELVQTVVASGRIMSPQRVTVGAVITDRVARIPVREGESVERGAVLIVLDDADERAAVEQARAAVTQAEARLRQLDELNLPAARQAFSQAEANALQARRHHERARELTARGFVSQSVLDDARRNLDVAESQLTAARLQVAASAPGGVDTALARAALAQARAALGAAQARLSQTVIAAPAAGTLIARNVEPGDVVQPGRELMVLAPAGETQAVVQIDEKNLAQLALGQSALASADAYPRERFPARLAYINPGVDALRGAVEVKLAIPDPPAYLRQDMTVSVDIEVARRAGIVILASEAVREAAGAAPWVLAVAGGRAERRPVRLGLKGEGRVEVAEGLAPGDRVACGADGAVKPGDRVRPLAQPAGGAP